MHKISSNKAIAMHVWKCSSPVGAGIEFYSQNGMSAIAEKTFGMWNVGIPPVVRKLRVKVVRGSK